MHSAELAIDTTIAETKPKLRLGRTIRRHIMGFAGLFILLSLVVVAFVGPYVVPYSPESQKYDNLASPSLEHPFGTDRLGRDVMTRAIYGTRVSLQVGIAAVIIGVIGGSLLGVISAYFGGSVDYLLQRLVEVVMSFPPLVLLILIAAAIQAQVGASIWTVAVILGVLAIPLMSRVVRSIVLSEKEQPYIEAARSLGATNWRLLFLHVFPSVFPLAGILAALSLGGMILAEAGLSFLGLGVPPPTPSLGADMGGSARDYFTAAPWLAIFPGLILSFIILGATMISEAVRDVVDPFARQGGVGK